jgi:hypothetical protein
MTRIIPQIRSPKTTTKNTGIERRVENVEPHFIPFRFKSPIIILKIGLLVLAAIDGQLFLFLFVVQTALRNYQIFLRIFHLQKEYPCFE